MFQLGGLVFRVRNLLPAFLLFFSFTVVAQWTHGAFEGEFGGHADEAAHYLSGLMIRDYVADLFPASPMEYAEHYYLHYPKIAIGHWPPFFYIFEAGWMLLFSPSRISTMLMMALLSSLLATTLYAVVRQEVSLRSGWAAGVVILSTPMVQYLSHRIMAEILVAVLVFWAMLFFVQYLDNESWLAALGFGLTAACAGLTKGSGFVLALLPPLGVLLTGRFRLLGRLSFWLPAVMVAVICGPWYLLAPATDHRSVDLQHGAVGFVAPKIYLTVITIRVFTAFESVLAVLAMLGIVHRVLLPLLKRERPNSLWMVSVGLVFSFVLFGLYVLPVRNPRHLTIVYSAMVLFMAAGFEWLFSAPMLRRIGRRWQTVALVSSVAILTFVRFQAIQETPRRGYSEAAETLLSRPEFDRSVMLVSSDGSGEGMMIAEIARRERRPGHYVLRASKMLANASWMGRTQELRYETPEEAMTFLTGIPVGVVVMDDFAQSTVHQEQLTEMLAQYRDSWKLIGSYGQQRSLKAYTLVNHQSMPAGQIRIHMKSRLGRDLEN